MTKKTEPKKTPEDIGLKRNKRREVGAAQKAFKQRGHYGVSRIDAFEAGDYILFVAANAMRWLLDDDHTGVSLAYLQRYIAEHGGDFDSVHDAALAQWRGEVEKHADVFMRYWEGGSWDDPKHVRQFGGVLDTELEESLDWLRENILALWT